MTRTLLAMAVLGAAACTPGPARPKAPQPHPLFPIAAGDTHEVGTKAFDGEIKCTSCHALTNSTYSKFECLGCHEHRKERADSVHASVSQYQFESAACELCHRDGVAAGAPPTVNVGGFEVPVPPAPDAGVTQAGTADFPHPAVPATTGCTSCHAQATGGRRAFGYDHALAPAATCAVCHEAGSDLVGTTWTLDAPGAVQVPATCGSGSGTVADRGGDTRPIGIAALACSSGAAGIMCGSQSCSLNHFYPMDCGLCHSKPAAAVAVVTTGAAFASAWRFEHFFGAPTNKACCMCHSNQSCSP